MEYYLFELCEMDTNKRLAAVIERYPCTATVFNDAIDRLHDSFTAKNLDGYLTYIQSFKVDHRGVLTPL